MIAFDAEKLAKLGGGMVAIGAVCYIAVNHGNKLEQNTAALWDLRVTMGRVESVLRIPPDLRKELPPPPRPGEPP